MVRQAPTPRQHTGSAILSRVVERRISGTAITRVFTCSQGWRLTGQQHRGSGMWGFLPHVRKTLKLFPISALPACSSRLIGMRQDEEAVNTLSTDPPAYLITFRTYGPWLHGDARGSVDGSRNIPGTPMLDADPARETRARARLKYPPVRLNAARRAVVQTTIVELAEQRDWTLHALEVRGNHVHLVIAAPETPERVLNAVTAWCTRRMVEAGLLRRGTKPWSRHGSKQYLQSRTRYSDSL